MTSNMAAITLFRALQFRSVTSFKCAITRLPRCHLCFVDSNDGNQSEVSAQEVLQSAHPPGKKLDLVVSCLRVDRVIASGLGMGRRKASDYIVARKLFVNKENCKKAFLEVKEGDEIDLALSKESDEVEVSRFKVLTIDKNQTKKNKRRLSGMRFSRIMIPRKEFDDHYSAQAVD